MGDIRGAQNEVVARAVLVMSTQCAYCKQQIAMDVACVALDSPYHCLLHRYPCATYFSYNLEWPHARPFIAYMQPPKSN